MAATLLCSSSLTWMMNKKPVSEQKLTQSYQSFSCGPIKNLYELGYALLHFLGQTNVFN
jgi:hypothetical protein